MTRAGWGMASPEQGALPDPALIKLTALQHNYLKPPTKGLEVWYR